MTSPAEALARILALLPPVRVEVTPLAEAAGRVLAAPVRAGRDEPSFPAAAMDGYALKSVEADPEAQFRVIGEAAAGHPFSGRVGAGEAVRILTGAPVPEGADKVVMQEQTQRRGTLLTLAREIDPHPFIRAPGADFPKGHTLSPPRLLSPADIALLAAMNKAEIPVARRPEVAILPTGDELTMPGANPAPGQILASNPFALAAIVRKAGASAHILPIARDSTDSLAAALAPARDADLILTTGGAAAGTYDLVAETVRRMGGQAETLRLAMRPGKRLILGRLHGVPLLGLPGTPVAAMVAARIFVMPAIRAMLGLPAAPAPTRMARLAAPLGANGTAECYLLARLEAGEIALIEGRSGLSACAAANALLHRPPGDAAREIGESVPFLSLHPPA